MTEEKKKPEDDEVSEEQLEDVAGGATSSATPGEVTQAKQFDIATPKIADHIVDGDALGTAEIDFMRTTDDDDD